MANSTSLEVMVTSNMTPYATSAFAAHSLVSSVAVVQGVVNCRLLFAVHKVIHTNGKQL
jgi:hypothetical protein